MPDVHDIVFYHVATGYKVSPPLTVGTLHEQILAVRRAHNEGDSASFQLARVGLFGRGELPGGVRAEVAGGWWGQRLRAGQPEPATGACPALKTAEQLIE